MIYMMATLNVKPDKVREFNRFLGEELAPFLGKLGMELAGSWISSVGVMHEVVDLWSFENFQHFERVMSSIVKDPEFRKLDARLRTMVTSETTKMLSPLPCSPLK
jgi:hypothetical protein